MNRALLPLVILLVAALAAACSTADADPDPTPATPAAPTSTATPTATPTEPPTSDTPVVEQPSATPTSPPASGTWDAGVQRVIDAVLARDVETLAALVRYREAPCEPGGTEFGQLACDEGEAPGTPVRFIWGPGCHGTDLRAEHIREHLARWTDGVTRLHAVAVLPPHFGEVQHEGAAYRVIFERTQTFDDGDSADVAIAYLLNEAGEIVMLADYCMATPESLLLDQSQSPPAPLPVLAPPTQ